MDVCLPTVRERWICGHDARVKAEQDIANAVNLSTCQLFRKLLGDAVAEIVDAKLYFGSR